MKRQTPCVLLVLLALGFAPRASTQAAASDLQHYRTHPNMSYRARGDAADYTQERCRLDVYHPTDSSVFPTAFPLLVRYVHRDATKPASQTRPNAPSNPR
jgi:hypothetical protein